MRDTPIRFDTGEPTSADDHRRIFVPLGERYEGTALGLLEDLEGSYVAAITQLDEVTALDRRFRDLVEQASERASAATAACRQRGELGLPTTVPLASLEPLLERRLEAASSTSDPVLGCRQLDEVIADLDAEPDRAERL